MLTNCDVRVKIVTQVAQIAGLRVFVEDQAVAFFHRPGVGGLLEMISPVLRLRWIQPGVFEIAQHRGRSIKRELYDDRVGGGSGAFSELGGTAIGAAGLQVHQSDGWRRRLTGLKKKMN